MTRNDINSWFQNAMSNGLVASLAWFVILILYCTFQVLHIDAPGLNQAFLLLTGGWVGMLTLAQSKKNTREEIKANEEKMEQLQKDIDENNEGVK